MPSVIICAVDKNGKVLPLGGKYDESTGLASLAISKGAGSNTFNQEYTANQTNLVIINPGTTQKVCIDGVMICGDGAAGAVSLDFAVSGIKVYRHYMTKMAHSMTSDMHIEGAANENLTLTTTTGATNVFISVNYRLVS